MTLPAGDYIDHCARLELPDELCVPDACELKRPQPRMDRATGVYLAFPDCILGAINSNPP